MYFYCQKIILSILRQIIGDVKAVRTKRILAVPHLFSIDIYIIAGFYSLEGKIDPPVGAKHGILYIKGLPVQAHRVIIHRRLGNFYAYVMIL
jgi:hypothetical protein